ncbi:TraR/DksA family transcriptional regulator [Ramlibacter albus]|uniref:TraR/DksA family transcriptional regulator n=1 Tax=Ramlibacter albus TaxID=2079448 RepID=A0A923MBN2_9BURK|nr:TraR/DksA family transcriptional regulator [Ramlibacter albus]MBC5766556.1 TraR/DksA family transcriptional regulator [Ramlibacter albus]
MAIVQDRPLATYAQQLARREQELRALLAAASQPGEANRDVQDFKDMAVEETLVAVDEAKAGQATRELGQVLAARRRVLDGTYGECIDCGEEIDPRRLAALPATPYCTACQALNEARSATPPPACGPGASAR